MNFKASVCLVFVLFINVLSAQDEDWDSYEYTEKYSIVQNNDGLFGIMRNKDKKLILAYKYSNIYPEEYSDLNEEDYYFIVDTLNKAGLFSIVQNKEIVPCKYEYVEGVYYEPNNYNYLDVSTSVLCAFRAQNSFESGIVVDFFAINGKLLFSTKDELEWSMVDVKNKILVIFYEYDNYANKKEYIVYDRVTGTILQKKVCEIIEYVFPDQFIVKTDGNYGVLDAVTGKYVINPVYDSISTYPSYTTYQNGKIGLLNRKGAEVFPTGAYDFVGFSDCRLLDKNDSCLICVSQKGKWGAIDGFNNVVLPLIYDFEFSPEDTMWVSRNGKWGSINAKGQELVAFIYDSCFYGGYLDYYMWDLRSYNNVLLSGKWGCVYNDGSWLIPAEYDCPITYQDTMFVVKNGKWICLDTKLNQLVNFNFDADTAMVKKLKFMDEKNILVNGLWIYSIEENGFTNMISDSYKYLRAGNTEVIKSLLPFLTAQDKGRLVHTAIREEKTDIFFILMESGPDLSKVDYPVAYILGSGLFSGHEKTLDNEVIIPMLKVLLEAGGDPNEKIGKGYSPLIYYVLNHEEMDYQIIEMLLKAGAKVKVKDEYGNTVFDYNKKYMPAEIKELLKLYAKNED